MYKRFEVTVLHRVRGLRKKFPVFVASPFSFQETFCWEIVSTSLDEARLIAEMRISKMTAEPTYEPGDLLVEVGNHDAYHGVAVQIDGDSYLVTRVKELYDYKNVEVSRCFKELTLKQFVNELKMAQNEAEK